MNTKKFLELALEEAEKAFKTGNYPCGALIVDQDGNIVAADYNQRHSLRDMTAHAEILCLRKINDQKLEKGEYFLFCSAEPCGGCSFFIARTNIKKVYWALTDPQKDGLADFKKNPEVRESFTGIEVFEEPYQYLKEKSADLLKKYYLKNGNSEKANLY